MALPKKLKMMNLFNEGNSYLGQTGEVTIPKLSRKLEDWRGGGMQGNVKIDLGLGDDATEFNWKLGGLDALVIKQFGAATVGAHMLRFTQIEVRKPSVPALRKIRISELLNGDVNSICTILPLCTSPTLSQSHLNTVVDPVDIIQLGAAVIYFLQPKSVRAELSLPQ